MDPWREAWRSCERMAFGQSPTDRDPVATLEALAARAGGGLEVDRYGGRELAERLERRVADLLGTEEAVWLPSGTMAQQIALRLHAERSGRRAVAFHPCCHVDVHEERGYEVLHGLRAAVIGERHRLLEPTDVEELGEPVAAVLLELPQRDLGGQLPAWEDLVATCAAARERGAALHLDGARLWQCSPFYDRPLAEVASLFDTVYVSFYKDLGAPAGCALGGSAELVAEARVWQVRHGGRLFTAFPFLLAAERGLDEVLPRMQELTARARESAAALAALDDVAVVPDPPHAAMLHALVRRPLEALNDAVLAVARETGTWPGGEFTATGDPGVQRIELGVSPANLEVPVDEIAELWRELLRRAEPDPA